MRAWRAPAAGLIASPVIWAAHQESVYVLVPVSCSTQMLVIPFVTLAAAIAIGAGAWFSMTSRQKLTADAETIPDARARTNHFLAQISLLASAVFLMAVVLQGVGALILGPCER
jgi:hypothetical protein